MQKHRIKTQALVALLSFSTLILTGTLLFHRMEKWSYAESFYFSVVTLTTVGYGDLHPTTDVTRIITACFILVGVTVAVTAAGVLGKSYLELRERKRQKLEQKKKQEKR